MINILISIASTIAECLVEPVLHQIQYLTQFNDNVEGLRKEVHKLGFIKEWVKHSVDAAQRNGEQIVPSVQCWISRVDEIMQDLEKFEDEIKSGKKCFSGLCPDWVLCYRLSKKSTKKVQFVVSLQEEGDFNQISFPPRPPGIEFLSSGDFMVFESSKSTMNQIIEALNDDGFNMVGVYGERGVGKTMLVKEVGKKVKELKLFDEVVMGVVSKTLNLQAVRAQMADMLGLKFQEESDLGTASRLYMRLKSEKKVLVILDDVCAKIDLDSLGIPRDHEGCKLLFMTRYEHLCNSMGIHVKKVLLCPLLEEEAWSLFGQIAGQVVESPEFGDEAREVARECGGLPLMIVRIGMRLRRCENLAWWRDLAQQLKSFGAKGKLVDFLDELD